MRLILVLICLALAGCSSMNEISVPTKATIQQIPVVEKLVWDKAQLPTKPKIEIKVVEEQQVAVLNKQGMQDLIALYSSAKNRTEETNKLVDVLNHTIDERNALLRLAQAEELRSNGLALDLEQERKARIADQKSADLQLTVTRLIAAIAIGFAL